jgi:hypothetical protein
MLTRTFQTSITATSIDLIEVRGGRAWPADFVGLMASRSMLSHGFTRLYRDTPLGKAAEDV